MNTFNMLANVSKNFIDYVVESVPAIELGWMENIIKWLIEGIGITGIGIIIFTLILKTVVLPLDIFSRYQTKKQSLVMKKMRPQMEKLQKQYQNDQQMYNAKVMELYKQNGYSMFGACIPLIASLVIFIFVIGAFSSYSRYANLEFYRGMVNAYNTSVTAYVQTEENPEGFLVEVKDGEEVAYLVDFDAFEAYYEQSDYKLLDENGAVIEDVFASTTTEDQKINVVNGYIKEPARQAAAEYYRQNKAGFLWINNIWYPDSMFSKELPNFEEFKKSISSANFSEDYEKSYNEVTANLTTEKDTFNGYFILIVLAIGVMLLQQWLSMRSQKDVNELGTVDGRGAQTNKMMMVMMPVMYGIFAFTYSASFSIYMITSSLYGLITMLIINKVMESAFAKKEAKEELERYTRKAPAKKINKK